MPGRIPGGISVLRCLLPPASPDLSPAAVARWPVLPETECPRCGAPAPAGPAALCPLCAASPPPFDAARSLFPYAGDVRAAIVAAKYGGRPFPARAVALRLRDAVTGRWSDLFPDGDPPTVVPVPAHPWKYLRRGFNLPALIGDRLARRAGFAFDPAALARDRGSAPQAGTPGIRRRQNVEGIFHARRGRTAPPSVLLLDDVYTTGATAVACSRALKSAGTASIVVVTVARTVP
ncbi:MAG: ComF family protein [Deltaproteobacteria bacterium]